MLPGGSLRLKSNSLFLPNFVLIMNQDLRPLLCFTPPSLRTNVSFFPLQQHGGRQRVGLTDDEKPGVSICASD